MQFQEMAKHLIVIMMLSSAITGFSTPVCLSPCECCVDAGSEDAASPCCPSAQRCCSREESCCNSNASCCEGDGLAQCSCCSCCLCGYSCIPAREASQFTLQTIDERCCSLHELFLVRPDRLIGRHSTSPFLLPIRLNVLFSVWLN